jgi:hypothetical protein
LWLKQKEGHIIVDAIVPGSMLLYEVISCFDAVDLN